MKWEDTVMKRGKLYHIWNRVDKQGEAIDNLLKEQAEISFKAGIRAGYNAGLVDGQYTNHKRHGKKMAQARLAGIKEVVETLLKKNNARYFGFEDGTLLIYREDWQRFMESIGE